MSTHRRLALYRAARDGQSPAAISEAAIPSGGVIAATTAGEGAMGVDDATRFADADALHDEDVA
jgi:hypothetical protein